MSVFAAIVCALCAVIFGALIRKSNQEYAVLLGVGAAAVILIAAAGQLGPLVVQIESLGDAAVFDGAYLAVLLKAVGIAIVGQLAANVCKDAGESALAYTVELAAKTAILTAEMPLLLRIFEYLEEILRF